ncbi:MAG: ribonuclease R [Breznakia sp.]
MEYKALILDVVYANKYKGMDIDGFKQYFHIESSKDFTQLMKDMNQLVEAYLVIADHKHRYFTLDQLGYFVGTLRKNPKGFGFVENEEISVYASRKEITKYLDCDEVLAKMVHNEDGSVECEIVKVIQHKKHTIIGVIKKKRDRTCFLPDTNMPHQKIRVNNIKAFKFVNDTKVQLYIEKYGKTLVCSIVRVLGYKYDPGIDILSSLLEHDIHLEFCEQVEVEVSQIKEQITSEDKRNREDFSKLITITIDGADSKDLDDAISIEKRKQGYRLGVHIADVSHYVKEKSALDKEAFERGVSVYVVDRVVPMLPKALSNGICSLNEAEERLTLSCIMDFDNDGNVVDYRIVPSFIKTKKRMTYTDVNDIFKRHSKKMKKYEMIVPMLFDGLELSKKLRKKKYLAGEIDFNKKEGIILVNEKGKVEDIVLRKRGEAERMIEDFMIATNVCVATHMKNMGLPSMYRVHEAPTLKRMREFANLAQSMGYTLKGDIENIHPKQLQSLLESAKYDEAYDVLSTYMLRAMQKARYDQNCMGHFGLALKEYTHFTSPIRRYPDLIVHRMLRKYCFHVESDIKVMQEDEVFIEAAALQSSQRERNAIEAERDIEQLKKCEYMERFIGKQFTGIISSITKFGMFVELENTIEGLVHITSLKDDFYTYIDHARMLVGEHRANVYKVGQKVEVKVVDASRFKRQIDFEIVSERKYKKIYEK